MIQEYQNPESFSPWQCVLRPRDCSGMDFRQNAIEIVGAKIRAERERLGIAQDAFAEQIQLDRAHYGKIERGRFNVSLITLLRIAHGLSIPVSKLLPKELDALAVGSPEK